MKSNDKTVMLFQSSPPDGPVIVSFAIALLSLTVSLLGYVCCVCVLDCFVHSFFPFLSKQSQIFIVFIIKQNMKLKTGSIGPCSYLLPDQKCLHLLTVSILLDLLPGWLSSKESAYNVGDSGSIPEWGRSPGGGNGNPFQYSCLENPMDRGAQRFTVHRVAKNRTRLND